MSSYFSFKVNKFVFFLVASAFASAFTNKWNKFRASRKCGNIVDKGGQTWTDCQLRARLPKKKRETPTRSISQAIKRLPVTQNVRETTRKSSPVGSNLR